jgi:UPF0755 protein
MRRLFPYAIFCFILVACLFVGVSFWRFHAPVHLLAPRVVSIMPGSAKITILQQLHQQGLAPSRLLTLLPLMLAQYPSLKAGEYVFEGEVTPAKVLSDIAKGRVIIHKFTLPEGHNIRQLRAALMAENRLTGEVPMLAEGIYLPETYHFTRGETRAAVIKRMQNAMDLQLRALWQNRADDLPLQTPAEALILASIIERETGLAHERGKVASVFINRLKSNIPLQADPTVAYGVQQRLGRALGRALRTKDLKTDSPWNTYTRRGLPQTAIANPGLAAIKAALHPDHTPYLYFVATGTGGHIFATSLKQHVKNVAAYRAQLRAAKTR